MLNNKTVKYQTMYKITGKRKEHIEKILLGVCDYYGITIEQLLEFRSYRDKLGIWKWKRYLIKILFDHTDLDITEIKDVLGYKSYANVVYSLNVLNEDLSSESYSDSKIKFNYNQLLKHLDVK